MLIDTHCHIYYSEVENAEEIIKECKKNNIVMILNGIDKKSNLEVLELSKKYDVTIFTLYGGGELEGQLYTNVKHKTLYKEKYNNLSNLKKKIYMMVRNYLKMKHEMILKGNI